MVIDNGCEQSIVGINSFLVQTFTGAYINMGGALSTMSSSKLEIVNDAFTLVLLEDGSKIIFRINQALLDLNLGQNEALLQSHKLEQLGLL